MDNELFVQYAKVSLDLELIQNRYNDIKRRVILELAKEKQIVEKKQQQPEKV